MKLKHRYLIHNSDIKGVMEQVFNFTSYNLLTRIIKFSKVRDEAIKLISDTNTNTKAIVNSNVDMYTALESHPYSSILKLKQEFIEYIEWEEFYKHVARVISIIDNTHINHELNKDSEAQIYKYNSIRNAYKDSQEKWQILFQNESIDDDDYRGIAGDRMDMFSVMSTVTLLCQSFNIDYNSAMSVPYKTVQTLLLMRSTQDKIQHELSALKEAKLTAKNKR